MPVDESEILWRCMSVIEAEKSLMRIKLINSVNMKQDAFNSFQRELHKLANPKAFEINRAPAITTNELADRLKGFKNG